MTRFFLIILTERYGGPMQIVKVFNNNVVQALNTDNEEVIVMGLGIGFQKKVNEELDPSLIDKIFTSNDGNSSFSEIYRDLPTEEVELVLDIIKMAETKIGKVFQANLYITLADHLHFALERHEKGFEVTNPLAWEVKRMYKTEYQIGKEALNLIYEKLDITIDENEAASIALHLVNAQKEGYLLEQTVKIVRTVQDILNIVRIYYGIVYDEDSISYNRFVTHLQYFVKRVVDDVQQGTNDSFLLEQVQASYPKAFAGAEKIRHYVESTHDFPVGREELAYLTIHIQRLTQ